MLVCDIDPPWDVGVTCNADPDGDNEQKVWNDANGSN
jgi:hypothetical protein